MSRVKKWIIRLGSIVSIFFPNYSLPKPPEPLQEDALTDYSENRRKSIPNTPGTADISGKDFSVSHPTIEDTLLPLNNCGQIPKISEYSITFGKPDSSLASLEYRIKLQDFFACEQGNIYIAQINGERIERIKEREMLATQRHVLSEAVKAANDINAQTFFVGYIFEGDHDGRLYHQLQFLAHKVFPYLDVGGGIGIRYEDLGGSNDGVHKPVMLALLSEPYDHTAITVRIQVDFQIPFHRKETGKYFEVDVGAYFSAAALVDFKTRHYKAIIESTTSAGSKSQNQDFTLMDDANVGASFGLGQLYLLLRFGDPEEYSAVLIGRLGYTLSTVSYDFEKPEHHFTGIVGLGLQLPRGKRTIPLPDNFSSEKNPSSVQGMYR